MANMDRINAIIAAFEERIQKLQTEGIKSKIDYQNDNLFCELTTYLIQQCSTSKPCLDVLISVTEFYPNILLKDISLVDNVINICKQDLFSRASTFIEKHQEKKESKFDLAKQILEE